MESHEVSHVNLLIDFGIIGAFHASVYPANSQGGPRGLLDDPDDSVIEGPYSVSSLFAHDFEYNEFEMDQCLE